MTRSFGGARAAALVLLGLLVVTALVAVWASRPERLRGWAEARLSDQLGREVRVAGSLEIAWGRRVRVFGPKLTIANPDWAHQAHLIEIARWRVDLGLWPALTGQFPVQAFHADQVTAWLEQTADGRSTWNLKGARRGQQPRPSVPVLAIEQARIRYLAEHRDSDVTVRAALDPDATGRMSVQAQGRVRGIDLDISGTVYKALQLADRRVATPVDLAGTLAGGARVMGEFVIHERSEPTLLTGTWQLSGDSAAQALAPLGVQRAAASSFKLFSDLAVNPQQIGLEGLRVQVGQSDLTGQARVRRGGSRPLMTADLRANRIDRSDFLAQQDPSKAADTGQPLPQGQNLPERLGRMDAQVSLQIDTLAVAPAELTDVSLGIDLERGRLRLDPLASDLASGRLSGEMTVDARDQPVALTLDVQLTGADFARLLRAAGQGQAAQPADTMHGRIDLAGQGQDVREIVADLNGRVALIVEDSAIPAMIVEGVAMDTGETLMALFGAKGGEDEAYPLSCAIFSFKVEQGVMQADPILIEMPKNRLIGEGQIDLARTELDLAISSKTKAPEIAAGGPIAITGPITKPTIEVKNAATGLTLTALAAPINAALGFFSNLGDDRAAPAKRCRQLGEAAGRAADGAEEQPAKEEG
ncbi:MAG: AsmA family protein [Rhodothalassiaceae bacterium]